MLLQDIMSLQQVKLHKQHVLKEHIKHQQDKLPVMMLLQDTMWQIIVTVK